MEINANLIIIYHWNAVISWAGCLSVTSDLFYKQQAPIILILEMNLGETETEEAWLNVLEVNVSSQVRIIIATH